MKYVAQRYYLKMVMDVPLQKTNKGQQAIFFLHQQYGVNIGHRTMNIKTATSFTNALKRQMFKQTI